jgi:hypothetical protein
VTVPKARSSADLVASAMADSRTGCVSQAAMAPNAMSHTKGPIVTVPKARSSADLVASAMADSRTGCVSQAAMAPNAISHKKVRRL